MNNRERAVTAVACGLIVLGITVWSGAEAVSGIVAGVATAALVPFLLPPADARGVEAMKPLKVRERLEVMRSVKRGERVGDRRLAAAAVSHAEYLQTLADWRSSPGQIAISLVGIVFWAVIGARAVVNERYTGLIIPVIFILLGAWSMWTSPRRTRRAEEAERLNRPLLGPGPGS